MRWEPFSPEWVRWFAWRPVMARVNATMRVWVWLEWIERYPAHGEGGADYRLPNND